MILRNRSVRLKIGEGRRSNGSSKSEMEKGSEYDMKGVEKRRMWVALGEKKTREKD